MEKLGFVGAGNMAEALIKGIINRGGKMSFTISFVIASTSLLLTVAGCGSYKEAGCHHQKYLSISSRVHVFYYPWYGNPETNGEYIHWKHPVLLQDGRTGHEFPGGDDISSNFYPEQGCYSSSNAADIEVHMQHLRRAGVGVICVTFWGIGSYQDKVLPTILDMAQSYGIKVNFHIEPFRGRNARTTRDVIVHIIDNYGLHPAFYRNPAYGNRPMFYIYDSYLSPAADWATILSPEGENTIRGTKYDSLLIALWVKQAESDFMLNGHFDGFYSYFAADGFTYGSTPTNWPTLANWAREHNKIFIPSVGPGYIDSRVRPWNTSNTHDRENGTYYDRMFKAAVDVEPPIISITSYDEWHEGTQIASAIPKQFKDYKYEDYSPLATTYYLDRTRYWVENYDPVDKPKSLN